MKKNVGTRPRKMVRTFEKQRQHRAEQAARAILAGRGNREANWARIGRCFTDFASAEQAAGWTHNLGLASIPLHLLDAAFPPAPEPVIEEPVVVEEPPFEPGPEPEPEPIPAAESVAA